MSHVSLMRLCFRQRTTKAMQPAVAMSHRVLTATRLQTQMPLKGTRVTAGIKGIGTLTTIREKAVLYESTLQT